MRDNDGLPYCCGTAEKRWGMRADDGQQVVMAERIREGGQAMMRCTSVRLKPSQRKPRAHWVSSALPTLPGTDIPSVSHNGSSTGGTPQSLT